MSKNILVVDDELSTLRLLGLIIKNTIGYDVLEAESGEAALSIIERGKEEGDLPSLILLDVMMPGIDGFELIKLLKADAMTRDIPVIFLTGLSDTKTLLEAFRLGASDYIGKPFNDNELIARIKGQLKISSLNSSLKEKGSILEVSLEILSGDSDRLFDDFKSLIEECRDSDLKERLLNCGDSLHALVMKTIGSLERRKRIYCLTRALAGMQLESKPISLEHTAEPLLYVESSRLVKSLISCLINESIVGTHPEEPLVLRVHRAEDQIILDIINKKGHLPENGNCLTELPVKANILRKEGGSILIKNLDEGGRVITLVLPAYKISEDLEHSLELLSSWFDLPLDKIKEEADRLKAELKEKLHDDELKHLDTAIFTATLDLFREKRALKKVSY